MGEHSKRTLTIVIIARNDEKHITYLLRSILRQKEKQYKIDAVIVATTGSTDKTAAKVSRLARIYPIIQLVDIPNPQTDAAVIKSLSPAIKSTITLILSPSITLKGTQFLHEIVSRFFSHDIAYVAPRIIPLPPVGLSAGLIAAAERFQNALLNTTDTQTLTPLYSGSACAVRTNLLGTVSPLYAYSLPHYLLFSARYAGRITLNCDTACIYTKAAESHTEFEYHKNQFTLMKTALTTQFGPLIAEAYPHLRFRNILQYMRTILNHPAGALSNALLVVIGKLQVLHAIFSGSSRSAIIKMRTRNRFQPFYPIQ